MKILKVTPYYEPDFHLGGVVRSTSLLCRELVKLGHEVCVYTTQHPSVTTRHPLGVPIDLGGVKVIYFKNRFDGFAFGLDMLRASKSVSEFDVVHIVAFWQIFGLPALLQAWRFSVPTVHSPRGSLVMVRDPSPGAFKHRAFYWMLNHHILKRASAVHFTAELERSDARVLGLRVPSFCLPNAVPVEEFSSLPSRSESRVKLGINDQKPVIAFIGRLDRRKALDMLLRAFSKASGPVEEANLFLAGPDGGEKDKLEELIRELGLDQRVRFLGLINSEQRLQILAAADLLTLTSLAENFGNAGAEALAAGVPVLITDQCGVAEGVEEAGVGRVIPVDQDALTRALEEMLGDPEELKKMGSRGPEFAASRYAAREVAKSTALAYADLCSGTRSPECRWGQD